MLSERATSSRRGRFRDGEEIKYWLDDVQCEGDEESLFGCERRRQLGIGEHNCKGNERARVRCQRKFEV